MDLRRCNISCLLDFEGNYLDCTLGIRVDPKSEVYVKEPKLLWC